MKFEIWLGRCVVFGLPLAFLVFYGYVLIGAAADPKMGNLWLMLLALAAAVLVWVFWWLAVAVNWGAHYSVGRKLGALPTYVSVIGVVFALLHLVGFLDPIRDEQMTLLYAPYVVAPLLATAAFLNWRAKEHHRQQV